MITPELLDPCTTLAGDDVVILTHNNVGNTSEKITAENLKKEFGNGYIAYCNTAAATATKEVTGPEVKKASGNTIQVFFSNGNTAANPVLSYNPGTVNALSSTIYIYSGGTKVAAQLSDMDAGTILTLMNDNNTWVIVGNPIIKKTNDYTKYADGTITHTRNTDFITLLSDNNVFVNYKIQDGIIFVNSVSLGGLFLNENAYTEIAQIPNYNRTLDVYFPVNSLGGSAICYGRINVSGLIEIYSNSATSYFSFTAITY